jgi:hypothetical protein
MILLQKIRKPTTNNYNVVLQFFKASIDLMNISTLILFEGFDR